MNDARYPLLVTIDVPPMNGRPRRTFQHRVEQPPTARERAKFEELIGPFVEELLERHPHWDRRIATVAAVSLIIERFDDLDTYERVCADRGLLPL